MAATKLERALVTVSKEAHVAQVVHVRQVNAWRSAQAAGASLRAIASAAGVSPETVRRALAETAA